MKDLRNNLAKARDEWLASDEGKAMLDAAMLRYKHEFIYLRNRIEAAFIAGWNAKEKDCG